MADYVIGSPALFNEDTKFFKDVYIYGTLYYDFTKFSGPITFNEITISGDGNFGGDVYIEGDLSVGILTVRKRLDVGIGGTVIRASADTGLVGIGITDPKQKLDVVGNTIISGNVGIGATTIPQQRLEVGGSIKIDANIYDSINVPGTNGYQLARDEGGIRWIPLIAESRPEVPGISTDGILVQIH